MFHVFFHYVSTSPRLFRALCEEQWNLQQKFRPSMRKIDQDLNAEHLSLKKSFLLRKTLHLGRTINWDNNRRTIPSSPNVVRRQLRSHPIEIRTPRPLAANVLIKEYLSLRICNPHSEAELARTPDE